MEVSFVLKKGVEENSLSPLKGQMSSVGSSNGAPEAPLIAPVGLLIPFPVCKALHGAVRKTVRL